MIPDFVREQRTPKEGLGAVWFGTVFKYLRSYVLGRGNDSTSSDARGVVRSVRAWLKGYDLLDAGRGFADFLLQPTEIVELVVHFCRQLDVRIRVLVTQCALHVTENPSSTWERYGYRAQLANNLLPSLYQNSLLGDGDGGQRSAELVDPLLR